jgi:hypothetical protein
VMIDTDAGSIEVAVGSYGVPSGSLTLQVANIGDPRAA